MSTITKEKLIEDLKASTQNSSEMFEIGEETICELMSLLTTPAAPVYVPDEIDKWQAIDDIRDHDESFRWDSADGYEAGWNACRSAMLQGGKS